MKFSASLFLFFCVFSLHFSFSQNCEFNYYNKKGSHYLFSTYFESDMSTLKDGICETLIHGELYERRVFNKGILKEEILNTYDLKPRVRTEVYDHPQKDGTIARMKEMYENGNFHKITRFYLDSEKRRSMEVIEYHLDGTLRFKQNYSFVKLMEIDSFNIKDHPEHTIDSYGYTGLIVPFGKQYTYDDQGKLSNVVTYEFLKSYNAWDHAMHGEYNEFYPSGTLKLQGFYKHGNKDGLWLGYYETGELYSKGLYKDVLKTGFWDVFSKSGKLLSRSYYNPNGNYPFEAEWIKEWDEKGNLFSHSQMNNNGKGFIKKWNQFHQLVQFTELKNNYGRSFWSVQDNATMDTRWYDDGFLKYRLNNTLKTDTSYISYFVNHKLHILRFTVKEDSLVTYIQNEWNSDGFLIEESLSNSQSSKHSWFFPDGTLKKYLFSEGNELSELCYSNQGILIRNKFTKDNILEGVFYELDTATDISSTLYYTKGIRNGYCYTKDLMSDVILNKFYSNGCTTNKTNTLPKLNDGLLLDSLKRMANYLLYNFGANQDDLTNFSISYRDSLAQTIFLIYSKLKQNKSVFHCKMSDILPLTLIFPLLGYQGLETWDDSNPLVKDLKDTLMKLNWPLPQFSLISGQYYCNYTPPIITTHVFLQNSFGKWLHNIQMNYPIEIDLYDHKNYMQYGLRLLENHSCYAIFEINNWQNSNQIIVYQDGEIEPKNQAFSWDQLNLVPTNGFHYLWND